MNYNQLFADQGTCEMLATLVAGQYMIPRFEGGSKFGFLLNKGIPPTLLKYIEEGGVTKCIEFYTRGAVCVEGGKVIRLTSQELEALEETNITLDLKDYVQPFPTVVFEFPYNYVQDRMVPDPLRESRQHAPTMAIMSHVNGGVVICIFLSSNDVYTTVLYPTCGIEDVEGLLAHILKLNPYDASLNVTEAEHVAFVPVIRAMMNACLAMDLYGCRRIGSADPKREKRLKRYLEGKPNQYTLQNIEELRRLPVLYGFDQKVKLYDTAPSDSNGEPTGAHVKPHWRRGHWRMQHFGVGNSMIRRIRIAPVLVNRDRYAGPMTKARVEYQF